MNREAICAGCAHFDIANYPDQAAQGMGRCTAYDQGENPVARFVRWDSRFTVLYAPAKDRQARRDYVAQMRAKERQPQQGEPA